jgi:hypothetical protein
MNVRAYALTNNACSPFQLLIDFQEHANPSMPEFPFANFFGMQTAAVFCFSKASNVWLCNSNFAAASRMWDAFVSRNTLTKSV